MKCIRKLLLLSSLYLIQINLSLTLNCYKCGSVQNPKECGNEVLANDAHDYNWTMDCSILTKEYNKLKMNGSIPPGINLVPMCSTVMIEFNDGTAEYTRSCGIDSEETICNFVTRDTQVKTCKVKNCKTNLCNGNNDNIVTTTTTNKSTILKLVSANKSNCFGPDYLIGFIFLFISFIC